MSLSEAHAAWLRNRKIDPELAITYGLRTVREGRRIGIEIPYSRKGKVITKKVRWINCGEPRWTHKGGGRILWNEDVIRDRSLAHHPIVVAEGEWDALCAISTGHKRTVSVPAGAKSKFDMPQDLKPPIELARKVILCGDNDDAGRIMNEALSIRFGPARCCTPVYPPDCKDLNDILRRYGQGSLGEALRNTRYVPIGVRTFDDYEKIGKRELFSSGWPGLNPHIKLYRGEFCVVTGIPGAGKSRLVLDMLANLNRQYQHRALICSFELPVQPDIASILMEHCWQKGVGELTDEEKARAEIWINRSFYFLHHVPNDNAPQQDLEWILARAEDAVFRHDVEWFLLDPWNQVEHRREKFEPDLLYQERAIRAIKRFAQTFKCGVFVVAHPTKAVVDKAGKTRMPTLYDVSGSAHWANAADHGLVVWRESAASQRTVIHCAKSRFRDAGIPGTAHLLLHNGRFHDTDPPTPSKPLYTPPKDEEDDSLFN